LDGILRLSGAGNRMFVVTSAEATARPQPLRR